MKKLTAILLSLILLLGLLAGCAGLSPEELGALADDILDVIDDSGEENVPDLPLLPDDGENDAEPEKEQTEDKQEKGGEEEQKPDPDGYYYSRDDVALYIHTYGELPANFITKKEAEKLGWSGGSVEEFKEGGAIGGSHFGNYEGLLPEADGREWTECDIDTNGRSSRGAKRIIFSNDGLIYYTDDHYESFTLLYTKEGPAE